jgi:type II secretory pathway pseudopilin PulG
MNDSRPIRALTWGNRAGAVLIIVAAMSALLASLTLAFLIRQRSSAEETAAFEQDIQARVMLIAGCNYIQETSRIGYDDGIDPYHREAFGWIDVRQINSDGTPMIGPNCRGTNPTDVVALFQTALTEISGNHGSTVDRPSWPAIGGVARCPMYVMVRPPFAVQLTTAYNPISTDPTSAAFGRPLLINPDPQPVVTNPSASQGTQIDYIIGDQRPRGNSLGMSWFRAYRDGIDTFVITCGAGATLGFNSWQEVQGANASAQFNNDANQFLSFLEQEARLWYRVQWSAAVATPDVHNIKNAWIDGASDDYYVSFPMNSSQSIRSQSHCKNMGGTFRFIERLRNAPTYY